MRLQSICYAFALCAGILAGSPFDQWTDGVVVKRAVVGAERHSMHSYFNTSPESPDGRWILFFSSTTPEAHEGEVRIRDRATGKEQLLASGVTTEDAHRVACQQWVSGGERVVFHDFRESGIEVIGVDIGTLKKRKLAKGLLVSWGQPNSDLVPVYGPHWAPGDHRDLYLLNVKSGEIRTFTTAKAVRSEYSEMVQKRFVDRPISIFFPILSPDASKIIFKLAIPAGGDFRSKAASDREMLIGYDLAKSRFLFAREKWGHPAWRSDSRTLINVPNVLIDIRTGKEEGMTGGLPQFPGSHPSFSPDGTLFVTDTKLDNFGEPGKWGVVVAETNGRRYKILHRFRNDEGAKSWRVSHPHPVFSPDGNRIYFNVSEGPWTRLYVAESGKGS